MVYLSLDLYNTLGLLLYKHLGKHLYLPTQRLVVVLRSRLESVTLNCNIEDDNQRKARTRKEIRTLKFAITIRTYSG